MIFRYDPLNYHIECKEGNNHLVMTCNRANRSSPRIRYNLKDTGRVYAASDVDAMLRKHGIFKPKIKNNLNLPFLFIWGRDSTAGFGTCNVPFDELESALQHVDGDNKAILKRAFYKHEVNHITRFDIWLELNDDVEFFEEPAKQAFHVKLIHQMTQRNEYFADEINRLRDDECIPAIQFFKRKCSPIAEPGGQRKQVLVFEQPFDEAEYPQHTRMLSRLTKKEYLALKQPISTPECRP